MPQLKMNFTNKNQNTNSSLLIERMSKYKTPTLNLKNSQHRLKTNKQTNLLMQPMINNVLNAKKGGCKSCGR